MKQASWLSLAQSLRLKTNKIAAFDDILLEPLYGIANIRKGKETNL